MTKTLPRLALLAWAVIAMTGCASIHDAFFDREYKLENLAKANLGITKRDEIIQGFGNPSEINKRWFEFFEAEVYYYEAEYTVRSAGNTVARQILACEFNKGILRAWRLHDTAPSAQQDFEDKDRGKLVKGSSTQKEVESLFGLPMAKALLPSTITLASLGLNLGGAPYPMAKLPEEAKEVWQYHHESLTSGGEKSAQKTLSVFFDAKGVFVGSSQIQELSLRP